MPPYLIPFRDDFDVRRADMSLGMRRAARYYNELVVPGIGGALRVRHFSWPLAGLLLKQHIQSKHSAIAIAHGIEALGNKLEWSAAEEAVRHELRVRGIRGFARNSDSWSFVELSQKRFYVQITHRQQCTRALPVNTGLGFTEGSSRFNAMQLTSIGQDLALAFTKQYGVGRGSPRLLANLIAWVENDFNPAEVIQKLRPLMNSSTPTSEERTMVLGRLQSPLSASTDLGLRDPQRRRRLLSYFENEIREQQDWTDTESLLQWLENNDGVIHAKDIRTAIAFEDMRIAGVNILGRIAQILCASQASLTIKECLEHSQIKTDLQVFHHHAKQYMARSTQGENGRPDAIAFALEASLDDTGALQRLLMRDGRILSLANNVIYPGPVFRPDIRGVAEQDSEEINVAGRPSRLFQCIALWRDCRGQA